VFLTSCRFFSAFFYYRDLEWAVQPSRTTLNRKRRRGDEVDWTAQDTGDVNTYMALPTAAATATAATLGPPVPTNDEEVAETDCAAANGGVGDHEMRSRKRAGALVEGTAKKKRRRSSENADSTPLGRAASSSFRPLVNKKRKNKASDPESSESESDSESEPTSPKFLVNQLDEEGNVVPDEMGMKEYNKVINSETDNLISLNCNKRVKARAFFRRQPDRSQDPDDVVAAPNTPTDITSIEGQRFVVPHDIANKRHRKNFNAPPLHQLQYARDEMKKLIEGQRTPKKIAAREVLAVDKRSGRNYLAWATLRDDPPQYLVQLYDKPLKHATREYTNEEVSSNFLPRLSFFLLFLTSFSYTSMIMRRKLWCSLHIFSLMALYEHLKILTPKQRWIILLMMSVTLISWVSWMPTGNNYWRYSHKKTRLCYFLR
jgi:hypothetical protein